MPALCIQYFLVFGVFGCIGPYLSAMLSHSYGLSDIEIGYVLSTGGIAVFVTPVLMTLLADAHLKTRWLTMLLYAIGAAALVGFGTTESFWSVLILFSVYCMAIVPLVPLQDGLTFATQENRRRDKQPELHYHKVRIWGSIGFMTPGIVLYLLLSHGLTHRITIAGGVLCCVIGMINAYFLPDVKPGGARDDQPRRSVPTIDAAKAMLEPHVLIFCIAIFLAQMAVAGYYGFYPRYLVKEAGIELEWAGLIAGIGVVIELPLILGFGWLMRKWGWKRLMVIGATCMVLRLAMLGLLPGAFSAIASQVFHGLWVVTIHVAPPLFLNRFAKDEFRNSIQGLFSMVVYGVGRIIGNVLSGYVAEYDLTYVFTGGAVLCLLSLCLFGFAFKDVPDPPMAIEPEEAPSEM